MARSCIFDSGVKGMVQDVRTDSIGVILFGSDVEIKEGSRVVRTGKRAGIGVGDAMLGRVVDALGAPIDGKGEHQGRRLPAHRARGPRRHHP